MLRGGFQPADGLFYGRRAHPPRQQRLQEQECLSSHPPQGGGEISKEGGQCIQFK